MTKSLVIPLIIGRVLDSASVSNVSVYTPVEIQISSVFGIIAA